MLQAHSKTIDEINKIIAYNSAFFVLLAIAVILFFYYSRKKILQKMEENKNLELFHQRELVNAVLTTQEEERIRISQDLHDDISSKLNVISLNSHLLQNKNLTESEVTQISNTIINYTQTAIESSRRIAHDLYPPVLQNFGLSAGIEELCLDVSATKAVSIQHHCDIDFEQIPLKKHLHLFRIVQELINNSIRHGKAKIITIDFFMKGNKVNFKYTDDGIGFDLLNLHKNKRLGLKNIESRVNFLKGNLKIRTYKNQGFQLEVEF
jgi:signal transduction histidine kinase